jgi:hypothetical protein
VSDVTAGVSMVTVYVYVPSLSVLQVYVITG